MATAHLFNCNSKTEVVTSLNLAYSSEDVLALTWIVKMEFLSLSVKRYSPTSPRSESGRFFALIVVCLLPEDSTALKR